MSLLPHHLFFFFFIAILPFFFSTSLTLPLSLSLSLQHPIIPLLASSSLQRAHHLKKPKTKSESPLFSHAYGGYTVSLPFGSPPQNLPLLLDTGSPLTWLPCTTSYTCNHCTTTNNTFLPKMSLSSKIIGCHNPKCQWIHGPHQCQKTQCSQNSNCSSSQPPLCPPYFILYGSGSTSGLLLSETLTLSADLTATDIAVGCSLFSDKQPAGGIAGFSRGRVSLPAQLNLSRFSYCLVSRRFDDNPTVAGTLVLNGEKEDSADGVRFAPFLPNPNPTVNDVFQDYYYVAMNRISVGGKKVRIPDEVFLTGPDGNGGVIIDSGTTFTYLEKTAFDPLVEALVDQVSYKRDLTVEKRTGLTPCFELPQGEEVTIPELAFHFKGGAEMTLPLENYFAVVGELTAVVCLTVVTDDGGEAGPSGPAMILGNFQQQNYYMVYDLEREKLGFRQEKTCVA